MQGIGAFCLFLERFKTKHCMVAFGIVGLHSWSNTLPALFARQPLYDMAGLFDTDPQKSQLAAKSCRTIAFKDPTALFRFSEAVILDDSSQNCFSLAREALTHFLHLFICNPSALTEEEMSRLLKISEESQVLVRFGGSMVHHPVAALLACRKTSPFFVEMHHTLCSTPGDAAGATLINLLTADLSLLLSLSGGMVCKAETSVPGGCKGGSGLECRLKIDNGSEIRILYAFNCGSPQQTVTVQHPGETIVADFGSGTVTCGQVTETPEVNETLLARKQLEAFAADIAHHESELIDRDILMFFLAHALLKKAAPWLKVNARIQSEV